MARKGSVVPLPVRAPSLELLVEEFVQEKRATAGSPRTAEIYSRVLRSVFLPWARSKGIADAGQLNEKAALALLVHLRDDPGAKGKPLSPTSVATYQRHIGIFIAWLKKRGEAPDAVALRAPKPPEYEVVTLSRGELQALEDAASTERDKLVVRVLADSGIRLGELLGLRTADVIERGRDYFIRVRGKTGEREVGIKPGLYSRLRRYAEKTRPKDANTDRLFVGLRRRPNGEYEGLTASGVAQLMTVLGQKAGIQKRVHPHLLRHSFATNYMNKTGKAVRLAKTLGHSSLQMIMKTYDHPTASDLRADLLEVLRDE